MAAQLPVSVNFPPAMQTLIMGLSCGGALKNEDIPLLKPFLDCSVAVWITLKEEFVYCFPPKDERLMISICLVNLMMPCAF